MKFKCAPLNVSRKDSPCQFDRTYGVMIIVIGNGHDELFDVCICHSANTHGKGMNPVVLPSTMNK